MACAPPNWYISVTPHSSAAYKISSAIGGGEHKITLRQPAIFAGVASIKTVDNKGAEPPGI